MSIEDKIRALLEAAEQPTAAQLAYPGATTPQDPAPYMGVGYEELELDRPGVVAAEIQQVQYPGQTPRDPAPYAGNQAQEIDPGQASALVDQAAAPAPGVAGEDASGIGAEFMELDPYDISSHVEQVAKENYPVGSGADDVQPVQDPAASQEEDEYSKGIKQAAAPAPGIAESAINEAYTALKPRKIQGGKEGKIIVIDNKTAAEVEQKLGLPKGALSPKVKGYSETAVVKGPDNKLHTVYTTDEKVRVRSYGHKDDTSTEALKKHLTEEVELSEAKNDTVYTVTKTHHRSGRTTDVSGTIDELIKHHQYTLETGKSYEKEKGNSKINMAPKNIDALVKNLNSAINNSAANGQAAHSYAVKTSTDNVTEATDDQNQDPQAQQDEIIQQAVAAVQSGNDIEAVSKATGLDVKAIEDAIDAAKPTASPSAPNTTAPVSEAFKKTTSGPVYKEAVVLMDKNHDPEEMMDKVDEAEGGTVGHPTIEGFIRSKAHDKDGLSAYKTVSHFDDQPWTHAHIDQLASIVDADHAHGHNPVEDDGKGTAVYEASTEIKSDMDALLAEEALSEEFKEKAGSLFEAAVVSRVNNEVLRLEEAFDAKLETEIQTLQEQYVHAVEDFTDKQATRLTNYINYLGEQWIKQNKIAVQQGVRTELTEGFMSGLQKLFTEHYINVPQEKFDLVEEQKQEIAKLQESIESIRGEVAQLEESNQELQRNAVIAKLSEGLTDTDVAKLNALCEGISFESVDLFESKVELVKTNFFKRKSAPSPEQLLESHVQVNQPQLDEQTSAVVAPHMAAYVKALDRFKH